MTRIGVLGAGAIGCNVATDLVRAGHDVRVVDPWPEQVVALRTRSLKITLPDGGEHAPLRYSRPVYGSRRGHRMSTVERQQPNIDLDEAQQLVDALERDLARVRSGEGDVATLQREVEALRDVLAAEAPHHDHVHEGLHRVMTTLESAGEAIYEDAVKVSDYVTRIGRLIGL